MDESLGESSEDQYINEKIHSSKRVKKSRANLKHHFEEEEK
jgi:hypothetical protein